MKFFKQIRTFCSSKEERILILPFDGISEDISTHWHKILKYHFFRYFCVGLICAIIKHMPSGWLKNFLLRRTGMKIGKNVFIGQGASLDPQFPQLITIEDNAIIGIDSHIMTHEITHTHVRLGKVKISQNALVGAMSIVRSGVQIGKNAVIGMGAMVVDDVEDNKLVLINKNNQIIKKIKKLI